MTTITLTPFLSIIKTTLFSFLSIFQRISGFVVVSYIFLSCMVYDTDFYLSWYCVGIIQFCYDLLFFITVFFGFFHFANGLKKMGFHFIIIFSKLSLLDQFELNKKSFHFIFFYTIFFSLFFLIFNVWFGTFLSTSQIGLSFSFVDSYFLVLLCK